MDPSLRWGDAANVEHLLQTARAPCSAALV